MALDLGRLLVDLGEGGVAAVLGDAAGGGELVALGASSVTCASAASRRSMISRTTSSRSPWRGCSEAISDWRFARSFGRGHLAGVEALLVAVGALAHRVDVLLGLGLLAGEVARLGLGGDHLVASRASGRSSSSISASSGRVRRRWASRSRTESSSARSSSRFWAAGAAFSSIPRTLLL